MSFEGQDPCSATYRPEIDGLRAIAVLAVMAYHACLPGADGGFAGVDIFFVISGYLITGILLRGADGGDFSFRRFYERRARRILPALYAVTLVYTPIAILTTIPSALRAFGASLAASALFSANFYFWLKTGGYFDEPAETMPLLHLWSLAVEEQFYIVYPLLLLAIWRFRKGWILSAMIAGLLVSLGASEVAGRLAPSANYFLFPTRGWELLSGGALACWQRVHGRGPANGRFLPTEGGAALGFALVAASLVLLTPSTRFPGVTALPIVGGTLLLLAFADPVRPTGRFLASPLLKGIGLISYSAYLLHQPLLVYARSAGASEQLSNFTAAGVLLATLAIAYASWRWIECPFRNGLLRLRTFTLLACATAMILTGIGAMLWATNGLPKRFPSETLGLLDLYTRSRDQLERCTGVDVVRICIRGRDGPVAWAFVGDSHAVMIAPAFDRLLEARHERALIAAVSACAPVLQDLLAVPNRGGCNDLHQRTLNYLLVHPEIHNVVLAARWPYYLERRGFDNGEGGIESIPTPPLDAQRRAAIAAAYAEMPRRLLAAGRRVILVYPVPEAGWQVPLQMVRRQLSVIPRSGELSVSHSLVQERLTSANAALDRIGNQPRLVRLFPETSLCTLAGGTRCRLELNGRPLYYDSDHLTAEGARLALPNLERRLAPER